jgi:hypothetical protein
VARAALVLGRQAGRERAAGRVGEDQRGAGVGLVAAGHLAQARDVVRLEVGREDRDIIKTHRAGGLAGVQDQSDRRLGGDRQRAGERAGPVGDGVVDRREVQGDEVAARQLGRGAGRDGVANQTVGAQREVRAVGLGAADREDRDLRPGSASRASTSG